MRTRRATAVVFLVALAWWLWPADEPEVAPVIVRADPTPTPRRFKMGAGRPKTPKVAPALQAPDSLEPTPPPTRMVNCPVPLDIIDQLSGGTARLATPRGTAMAQVTVHGDHVSFLAPFDAQGVGSLLFPGWSAVDIYFGEGACEVDPFDAPAVITGMVVATEGVEDDRIIVRGCGAYLHTDSDGSFYTEIDAEPCTLTATRRDGRFTVRADPLFLDPLPGEEIDVELIFPPYRAAGVGVGLWAHPRGMVITDVFPNTPAALSGLRSGDIIVGLDGAPTQGLDTREFVDLALGPSGSDVVYTVERDGEPMDVELVRELLD